jgi:hypothetical protein
MKALATLVENEVRPLSGGDVLHEVIEKLSVEDRLTAYCIIQFMQDKLAKRRELMNARLKADVKQVGTTNDKGHMRFEHNGTVATVEKRVGKMPDEEGLRALMEKAGLEESDVFDKVTSLQLNPSKVENLIELGKLKRADVEVLCKTTFALTVDPSEHISKVLTEAAKAFEAEKAAITGQPPAPVLTEGEKPKKGKKKSASAS